MRNLFGQVATSRGEILGCHGCPLNKTGIKIKGLDRIKRRRAMIWGQSPSLIDLEKELEFSGESEQLLWRALRAAGLSRKDFDVQNVIRCALTDDAGEIRDPSKRELRCCSVYNDEALQLNQGRADVHVILGDVAGAQLLGKDFHKDRPIYWHEPWNAYVLTNWSPSFLLRIGGEKCRDYVAWSERFRGIKSILDHPGKYGYLKSRSYQTVQSEAEFDEMERAIRAEQGEGRRISVDIEDGVVNGERVLLLVGFGTGHFLKENDFSSWEGRCWSVVVDHPEAKANGTSRAKLKARLKTLIEDASLMKTFQNGSSDGKAFRRYLGARLAGYDYDTMYGTFLRYSFMQSCGLDALAYRFFPEFADYKDVAGDPAEFGSAPLDDLVLRNCGDCDVTQRLEQRFAPQISYQLNKVYIHAGKTLEAMEDRGPILDWESWKKAEAAIPEMVKKLDRMLQHVSGVPDFNADSDKQVAWLVYDHLGLPVGETGRSTLKAALENLAAEHPEHAIVLELISKRRAIGKIKSTYLNGFAASARLNRDEVHTIWWLTGAVTGRLRSGKGDRAEAEGIVNLQNLHGNPMMQNLLVSDRRWRDVMRG